MSKSPKPESDVVITTNNEPQINERVEVEAVVEERPGGVTVTTFVGVQPDLKFAEAN